MKKILPIAILLLLGGLAYYNFSSVINSDSKSWTAKKTYQTFFDKYPSLEDIYKAKGDRLPSFMGAKLHWDEFAANAKTGEVNVKDILESRNQVATYDLNKSACSESSPDFAWESMGPNNVGGRTRALLVDKDNQNLLISGGVASGVFVSQDRGANWTGYNDPEYKLNIPVASIAQTTDGTVYVGTGEYLVNQPYGFSTVTHVPGTGLYKSTDRGASFSLLEASAPGNFSATVQNSEWAFIISLAAHISDPNTLFVGTNRGLYITTDAGNSFTKFSESNGFSGSNSAIWDVFHTSNGKLYVLTANNLFMSSDDGQSFTDMTNNPGLNLSYPNRKHLAVSPSDPNYLYIVTSINRNLSTNTLLESGYALGSVMQSKDGGLSWEVIGKGGSQQFDLCGIGNGSQCWYDLAITVDPINPERIFLGGILLWSWTEGKGWIQLDDYDFGTDNPQDPYYLHPDKHRIVFDRHDPNVMYVLSDGGISRSDDAQEERPTFRTFNKGYNTAQFYAVAATYAGQVLGGTQDNGTNLVDYCQNSFLSAEGINGGDGAYVEASKFKPKVMFAESQFANMGRSSNGGESFSPFFDQNIAADMNEEDGTAPFITSFFLFENIIEASFNQIQKATFFTGGTSGKIWAAPDILNLSHIPVWTYLGTIEHGNANRTFSSITYSNDGSTIFACSRGGGLLRVKDFDHTVDSVSFQFANHPPSNVEGELGKGGNVKSESFTHDAFNGRYTSGITMNPNNILGEVIVTAGNYGADEYIWISNNANTGKIEDIEFESLQKNLPPIPIHDVAFHPSGDPTNYIVIGTEQGVWSYNKTEECWREQITGMGRVPVHRIRFEPMRDPYCPVLYVGTHAKGIFRSTVFSNFLCDTSLDYEKSGCEAAVGTNIDPQLQASIKVYPNPVTDGTSQVELELENSTKSLIISVFGMDGRLYKEVNMGQQAAGKFNHQLDLQGLPAGNYIVYIAVDQMRAKEQIVIVE